MNVAEQEALHPSDLVTIAIQGDMHLLVHGSKEMPVLGRPVLGMSQENSSEVQFRVGKLNKYIESLQAK